MDWQLDQEICALSDRIRRREVSPTEVTRALLERIVSHNPSLNAYITVAADRALSDAKQAEASILAGSYKGPLHGIPIAHKDVLWTRGIRTTAHSRATREHVPDTDASVVAQLASAGTILVGKLNTYEFACGATESYGVPINPWRQDRTTGGSSSGGGSAIADGLAFGATGTDTAGSIRGPASYCGVVGLKPTYGLVSRSGLYPLSWSLDHVGPMARSARDIALLLQQMVAFDAADASSISPELRKGTLESLARASEPHVGSLSGLRIGVPTSWLIDGVQQEIANAAQAALAVLRALGAEIREVSLPLATHSMAIVRALIAAESSQVHTSRLREYGHEYAAFTRQSLLLGACISSSDYLRAQAARHALRDEMATVLQGVDVLAWPTTRNVAPLVDLPEEWGVIQTQLSNITGHPSLSVPCGFDHHGLPIGLLLTGRLLDDAKVIRVGVEYQAATEWRGYRPSINTSLQPPSSKPYVFANLRKINDANKRTLRDRVVRALHDRGLPRFDEDIEVLAASLQGLTVGLASFPDEAVERFEPLVHQHVVAR